MPGGQRDATPLHLDRTRAVGSHRRCRGDRTTTVLPGFEGRSRGLAGWRWPLIVSLAITLLVEIPHQIALAQAGRDLAFVGMFWSAHDVSQYLAAMREGAAGAWLIENHLSGEPHAPALMYGLYVLIGKLTALLGGDFERMYVLAASIGRFLLMLAVYAATGLVTDHDGRRRLAFCLVVFGSGLSAVLGIGARIAGVGLPTSATDLNQVEVSTFLALFTAPHLMIGLDGARDRTDGRPGLGWLQGGGGGVGRHGGRAGCRQPVQPSHDLRRLGGVRRRSGGPPPGDRRPGSSRWLASWRRQRRSCCTACWCSLPIPSGARPTGGRTRR